MSSSGRRQYAFTASFLALGILLLLHRTLLLGEAFVPGAMLGYLHPWAESVDRGQLPAWNPLHYDAVGQFHVWRTLAGRSIREGLLPLWNPFAFMGYPAAGTSQSALFYPPNWLHALLPSGTAAGWLAAFHLMAAGLGAAALSQKAGARTTGMVIAALTFSFGAWQVSWLQLPTFAATSCWIPWAMCCVWHIRSGCGNRAAAGLALSVGLMLLGGHLQIAFYGLIAVLMAALLPVPFDAGRLNLTALGRIACGVVLGGMLSMPQVLPALELSRYSHRVSQPSAKGFADYCSYTMPAAGLGGITVPALFGTPADPARPYVGVTRGGMLFNYAEGALYAGIAGLPFMIFAAFQRRNIMFTAMGILALLMALGTAVNAPFYFYVPGFGQSGSPGRALVLFALAASLLAASGAEECIAGRRPSRRSSVSAACVLALLCVLPVLAVPHLRDVGADLSAWFTPMLRQPLLLLLGAGSALALMYGRRPQMVRRSLPLLVLLDLFAAGYGYNRTTAPSELYKSTPLLTLLSAETGHDRIMPVHRGGFSFAGPQAVLPPNGAGMFGLRDVQGYDSLFPGRVKQALNALAGPSGDASPPEVGNMVFVRTADTAFARLSGVRFLLSLTPLPVSEDEAVETVLDGVHLYALRNSPGRARVHLQDGTVDPVKWNLDAATRIELITESGQDAVLELADLRWPGWKASVDGDLTAIRPLGTLFRSIPIKAGRHRVAFQYDPSSVRIGLFLCVLSLAVLTALLFAESYRRPAHPPLHRETA